MTDYKIITNNDDDDKTSNASGTSGTQNPAKNRKRHKPGKGLPRV